MIGRPNESAPFNPFGETVITIPLDHVIGKHRGFAFFEFETKAGAAISCFLTGSSAKTHIHNSQISDFII